MKKILFTIAAWLVCGVMFAQKMVYLEHCETLSFDKNRLPDAQLLKGNVRFRHEEALMYCDSAYFYEKTNSFDAFGHVRFVQGDTLEGVGDVLYYDGNTRVARLRHNVRLTHITTVLTTDSMNYDRTSNLAYYFTGGKIVDDVNSLESVWGSYCPSDNQAVFRNTVHLQNESFTLDADTLVYNTETNVATLVCPTTIVYKDETTILSSNGWYNTATERSMLLDRSRIIHHNGKELTGDTIYYDKKIGVGNVFGNMEMTDTVQHMTLLGNYGIVHENEKSGFATDSAYMIEWSQENKTYIHADTLFTEEVPFKATILVSKDSVWQDSILVAQAPDTIYKDSLYRQVRAFFHVRAYCKDYQFVCDSMVYCGKDSMATMFHEPVCWSEQNQISADTIFVYLKNGTIDYAHGVGSALGVKKEGEEEYDQLSGKEMRAFVRGGELKEVEVSGNAETVFYPRDADSTYVGVNKSQSSYVNMFMENNKVHHVLFTTETTGTLYPLDQIKPAETRLVGFFWAIQERPTSPMSIFDRPERTVRPTQRALSAVEEEEEPVIQTKEQRNRRKK
ncbi:MAG: hypothetical protein MJZ64_05080 [Paludibacteraceae bacterium]|nr:hypothetical protein [Paludibacteraceae bacterium]